MSGIDDPAEQIDLVRLSSVTGNKELYLNYVPLPAKISEEYDKEFVDLPVLLVKRWRPLDPFSQIHDDLLPIYLTLRYLCHNTLGQKSTFYPEITNNFMFEKCEFCEKWDFVYVNFVRNEISER